MSECETADGPQLFQGEQEEHNGVAACAAGYWRALSSWRLLRRLSAILNYSTGTFIDARGDRPFHSAVTRKGTRSAHDVRWTSMSFHDGIRSYPSTQGRHPSHMSALSQAPSPECGSSLLEGQTSRRRHHVERLHF